jgi:hypothetical protein
MWCWFWTVYVFSIWDQGWLLGLYATILWKKSRHLNNEERGWELVRKKGCLIVNSETALECNVIYFNIELRTMDSAEKGWWLADSNVYIIACMVYKFIYLSVSWQIFCTLTWLRLPDSTLSILSSSSQDRFKNSVNSHKATADVLCT